MKPREWVLVVAAIAVAIIAGNIGSCYHKRAVAFEARAQLAEDRAANAQVLVDLAQDEAAHYQRLVARRDTVIRTVTVRVAVVDSLQPPDSACAPNLAVRDTLIVTQAAQISDLHNQTMVQAGAIMLLQASKDELQRALASRPKVYPRILGPNIGLGIFVGYCGVRPCVGVGATINVGGVRL
jgi:hypothetical protein